jgi:hypothetical protein
MADDKIRLSPEILDVLGQKGIEGEDLDTLLNLAKAISDFESNSDVSAIQESGGPARGMYQYEQTSAKTAVNRATNFNVKAPWLQKLKENNFDVVEAGLNNQEQTELFILDHLGAINNFTKTIKENNPSKWFDYWAKYHKRAKPTEKERERWEKMNLTSTSNPSSTPVDKQSAELFLRDAMAPRGNPTRERQMYARAIANG